jgi:hypothetical protein
VWAHGFFLLPACFISAIASPAFERLSGLVDGKGRVQNQYHCTYMDTPYGKLKSLPSARSLLKPRITFEPLDAIAPSITDKVVAQQNEQG